MIQKRRKNLRKELKKSKQTVKKNIENPVKLVARRTTLYINNSLPCI